MKPITNSRIAGATFLIYIAVGMTSLYLSSVMIGGAEDPMAKLAAITGKKYLIQVNILLTLVSAACALALAVTIYGLTRDVDREIALMAMCCRVAEGIVIVIATIVPLAMMEIAALTSSSAEGESIAFRPLAIVLFKLEGATGLIAATCFALGSTLYCYLFVRARSIPAWLAWLGLFSSIILVALLPLIIAGVFEGLLASLMWLPMLVFELIFAVLLLLKGVRPMVRLL
jgi:hypothetical protein